MDGVPISEQGAELHRQFGRLHASRNRVDPQRGPGRAAIEWALLNGVASVEEWSRMIARYDSELASDARPLGSKSFFAIPSNYTAYRDANWTEPERPTKPETAAQSAIDRYRKAKQ